MRSALKRPLGNLAAAAVLATVPVSLALADTAPEGAALRAWNGEQRALILLLEWADKPAPVEPAVIEETFFATGENATSVRQFFHENTHGAFDMTGEVLSWRASSRRWGSATGCSLGPIVSEAWRLFSGSFDVGDFDADGNGKVDNLIVVHSGRIGSDRVGPECTFVDDRRADFAVVFQAQGLGSIGTAIPIGFYIHEGGHGYYGLPDLYGDHYNGRYGIGMWGMMGLGAWGVRNDIGAGELFRVPAHFEPYSKVRMGWMAPRVVTTTTRGVELRPIESMPDLVRMPVGSASYYLEYRSPRGAFSSRHHGHGLLIWRNYTLIQADGRDDINNGNALGRRPLPPIDENFGDDSDPFPGSLGVTSYTDAVDGVSFENIAQYDDRIVLDIVVTRQAPAPWAEDMTGRLDAGAGVELEGLDVREWFDGSERL